MISSVRQRQAIWQHEHGTVAVGPLDLQRGLGQPQLSIRQSAGIRGRPLRLSDVRGWLRAVGRLRAQARRRRGQLQVGRVRQISRHRENTPRGLQDAEPREGRH